MNLLTCQGQTKNVPLWLTILEQILIQWRSFGAAAERIAPTELARVNDPQFLEDIITSLFQPKGQMNLEALLFQSIIGPIGMPAAEAV